MEGLAQICGNWGTWKCHSDIRELKYSTEGESLLKEQVGEELEKLDVICKKCKSSHFIVKEEMCPACNSEDVEITGISHCIPGMEMTHGFRCNNKNCEALFWIFEKDLK
jgi:Zn finger protein HypA/HybF involved in hydrogenase expression